MSSSSDFLFKWAVALSLIVASTQSVRLQVFVEGRKNLNRAVSDDIVAVEVLPRELWSCPSSLLLDDAEDRPAGANDQDTVRHDSSTDLGRLHFLT